MSFDNGTSRLPKIALIKNIFRNSKKSKTNSKKKEKIKIVNTNEK